jgi:hypothetical protein
VQFSPTKCNLVRQNDSLVRQSAIESEKMIFLVRHFPYLVRQSAQKWVIPFI